MMLNALSLVLKLILQPLAWLVLGYYKAKHKASKARNKANEKVNEIRNKIKLDPKYRARVQRLRGKK